MKKNLTQNSLINSMSNNGPKLEALGTPKLETKINDLKLYAIILNLLYKY